MRSPRARVACSRPRPGRCAKPSSLWWSTLTPRASDYTRRHGGSGPGQDRREARVKTDELDAQVAAMRRLALAQIRQYPDPVLRLEAQEVEAFDGDLAQLVERMIRLMQDARGVGLAANQVGVLRRLFVIQADEEQEPRALVNPVIVERSDESGRGRRGLSLDAGRRRPGRAPGASAASRRATPRANPVTLELEGLPARVAQHELDHLDGVLILDRTTPEGPPRGDGRPAAVRRALRLASRRRRRSEQTSSNGSPRSTTSRSCSRGRTGRVAAAGRSARLRPRRSPSGSASRSGRTSGSTSPSRSTASTRSSSRPTARSSRRACSTARSG